jgi:2-polyprenyl-3-methyl-5-hydroxy-6-metoxy-1,4-benzoquinol methylase
MTNQTERKDYTKPVRCNLCGSDDYTLRFPSTVRARPTVEDYVSTINRYGDCHDIVTCKQCGLTYMREVDQGIVDLYGGVEDAEYLRTWEERAETFRGHLAVMKKYREAGQVLDVGCYGGIFIHEARRQGYELTGVEPSAWAAAYAAECTGVRVVQGDCLSTSFPDDSFDMVTLWDVIEHLEDPLGCLRSVHGYLRDEGLVFVTTHDIESRFARMLGRRYPWLMRFHLVHFSPRTLSRMLEEAGFAVEEVAYYSKRFSLRYLLGRFGINVRSAFLDRIKIPINTGDMFMAVARKR